MKKNCGYILFILLFVTGKTSYSQQSAVTIYYSYSEKSKDNHSTTENFSLTDSVLSYSVKYSGRRGPDQKDENKECTLSSEQISKIDKIISEKKLNVTDSLIDNKVPDGSYRVTTAITVTVTRGNKTSKTKVKGSLSVLENKTLYKNAAYLLNTIRRMLNDCR